MGNKEDTPSGQHPWTAEIPDDQWAIYQRVITTVRQRGLPFALGGAFAVATYTGRWRNTKDLDMYILPEHRETMIETLSELGLADYYAQEPYERHWIYRSHQGDIIVDAIWAMANERAVVDEAWLNHSPHIHVRGDRLPIIPPEEMVWAKLYVLQKERSDWPDIFNVFYSIGPLLNWEHLIGRLGSDVALLSGILAVFAWLAPDQAAALPGWVWPRLHLSSPHAYTKPDGNGNPSSPALLDTRPWFGPLRS